ncbi:MAG: hypothetical protein ACI8UD_000514 [Planctomycetota bacterium]
MLARLVVVCVVELIVVAWLTMQVFATPIAAAPQSEPAVPAASFNSAPQPAIGETQQSELNASKAATTEMHREPVAMPWQPDDPVAILLTGVVRWSDGGVVESPSVTAKQGKVRADGEGSSNGNYALVGLTPGEWQVQLHIEGGAKAVETLVITDDATQTRDFVVDRTFPIVVKIVSADGEDGTRAMRKAFGYMSFQVAGNKERIPDRLAPTDGRRSFLGDAKWRPEQNPDKLAGTLHLTSSPAHVALLFRHIVIDQQVVAPGQTEMKFIIDIDALKALAGSASVRVLDLDTGQPIEGATVSGSNNKTGSDGRVVLENRSPGMMRLQIDKKGYETIYTTVQITAGQRLELGDMQLGPKLQLTGKIVDADGKPVGGAQITWAKLKWLGSTRPFATNRKTRSEADGSFVLWNTGRGPIAVTALVGPKQAAHGVFENPQATPVVMRLAERLTCTVNWPKDPTRAFTVMLFDEQRRPLTASVFQLPWGRSKILMPRGNYAFEVHDERHQLLQSGTLLFGDKPCHMEIR